MEIEPGPLPYAGRGPHDSANIYNLFIREIAVFVAVMDKQFSNTIHTAVNGTAEKLTRPKTKQPLQRN